jgi:hypothetical protein
VIAWATVENAIHAWVVAASGLAAGQVYWTQDNGPRPTTGTVIALTIEGPRQRGRDWVRTRDAAVPAPGAEIEHVAEGNREITIEMQCFDGAGTGTSAPRAILDQVVSAARLPARHDALVAAGIGLFAIGPILSLGKNIGPRFEPRAVVEARANLSSEVVQTGTYIGSVEVTRTVDNESDTFIVDLEG